MSNPAFHNAGLAGKTVIVTGGSRGIGRAIVETLAHAGADVTFTYLSNKEAAQAVVTANPNTQITPEEVDVRNSSQCAAFIEKIVDRTGQLDILINNAGIIRDNTLALLEDDDIQAVLDTNVTGVFNMARAAAPYFISQRSGKIINISSVSGEKGGRGQTPYAASKGAINALTKSLAVELAPRGITVNAVAPGVIETEMSRDVRERAGDQVLSRILLRRYGKPEDIAHAVAFLASQWANYITGEILHVDGGFKME
jgi:3-oxoacyl-[acyl-carrier protein] reductase